MRRVLLILGLEVYAASLAFLQALGGVHTDEAKYLLNIPYPHPPAVRWLLSRLDAFPFQETAVRILFATLMVQAVWLLWDMAGDFPRPKKFLLAGLWLFSGGVLLQAGTVMMAPLTALEALLFLWMLQRKTPSMWVGFLWLFSLFTAYQAVLFFPLVFACLRQHCSVRRSMYYLLVPVALLVLYTFTNPLILSSVVTHSNRDLHSSLLDRLLATGRLWAVGGSVILSMLGTWGILRSRRWELAASLFLVVAYIAFSRYDYYAVLFLPLFIGGVLVWPKLLVFPRITPVLTAIIGFCLAFTLFAHQPLSSARTTVQLLEGMNVQGTVLIEGSFGHEWQYESPWEIRRFSQNLLEDAGVVVCLQTCPDWEKSTWRVILFEPEVWVRSKWLS